jgi:hypothetical protein
MSRAGKSSAHAPTSPTIGAGLRRRPALQTPQGFIDARKALMKELFDTV